MTTNLMKGWVDELKLLTALPITGGVLGETLKAYLDRIEKHLDSPLRMFASTTPDAKINFAANRVVAGDNSSKSTPAVDDLISSFVASTLNLQSGATTGGTFYRGGVAFTMPTVVSGNFYRVVFMYRGDNIIDSKFSPDGYASYAAMNAATDANPGTLFAALDGVPIGWIDLVATSTSAFKTASSAGSSATNIIENAVSGVSTIFRISAGGGAGGGSDRTYKLGSFSATGATLKGGYAYIDDSRVVSSGVGATSLLTGIDQIINLNTVLTNSGLAAIGTINSAASKLLALVLDLSSLGAIVTLTDNKRKVYQFAETNLRFIDQADLTLIDPRRYVLLDQVFLPITVSSWATATGIVKPSRVHDSMASYFPYVQRYATQITSASATNVLTHGLDAEPQVVDLYYYDGTNKIGLDLSAHLLNKTATQLNVSSLGLTFGGGQYLEVVALYIPTIPNIASASRTFTSPWFTSNATTTVAHGLSDMEDIRGLQVQEWDVTAGKRRVIDTSALIVNFDAVNVYLNWTGLVPSSTLQYRFFVGGSPIPWSIRDGAFDTITNASGAGAPNFPNGATGISTGINSTPVAYRLTKQAIGVPGTAGQIASAHALSLKSFSPAMATANRSWFPLSANGNDGSLNAHNIPLVGAFVNTTDPLGGNTAFSSNAGTNYFQSTDAFFDAAATHFAFAGWFKSSLWVAGGSNKWICEQAITARTSISFWMALNSGGLVRFGSRASVAVATDDTIQVDLNAAGVLANDWIHLAMTYNSTTKEKVLFLNGQRVASQIVTGIGAIGASRQFAIGGTVASAASEIFEKMWQVAFVNGSIVTDEDIRKLYSARLDHNLGISVTNQKWSVNFYGANVTDEDTTPTGWLVDKFDTNSLFYDFSQRASTDQVEMFMEDRSLAPTTVGSQVPYDVIHTVNPTFPIAHGQTGVPELTAQGELSSGVWEQLNLTGHVSADSTNFVTASTLASFFTAGYLRVRLVARNVGPVQTGVPLATTGLDGLIGSRAKGHQNMGGLKGFIDGSYSVGNLRDAEGAGTTTLNDDDRRNQVFNLTAARTVVLPSTSVLKGDVWVLTNRAAFDLTVQASGGSSMSVANGANLDATVRSGFVRLVALQDAPTSPAHWFVEDVLSVQTGSLSASFTAGTYKATKRGNVVTVQTSGATWASASSITSGVLLPAHMRPPVTDVSNVLFIASGGRCVMFSAKTTGALQVQLFDQSFTLSADIATNYAVDYSVTYMV